MKVFLLLALAPVLNAQYPADAQTLVDVLNKTRSHFDGILSLHSTIIIEKKLEPAYQEEVEKTAHPNLPTTFEFEYWEKSGAFNYILTNKTKGFERFTARHARVGNFDQYLSIIAGAPRLKLTHHPIGTTWLDSENAVLLPFGFLAQRDPSERTDLYPNIPDLQDILNPTFWTQFAQNPSLSISADASNTDTVNIGFKVKGPGNINFGSSEYTYHVTFSKKAGFFPIGYQKLDSSGTVVFDVQCRDISNANSADGKVVFNYAKEITAHSYNKKGALLITVTAKVNTLDINTVKEETRDALFNIDPASVDAIEDLDSRAFIKVPH